VKRRKTGGHLAKAAKYAAALRRTREDAGKMLKQAEAKQAATHAALVEAWREYHRFANEHGECAMDDPIICRGCFELKNLVR